MDQKPHKYHYVSDPNRANRALVLFDEPPQSVEVHALVTWHQPFGPKSVWTADVHGWAVVIFFRLMGTELILGVRTRTSEAARRFRNRLLNPSRANVLLRNATVVQHQRLK